MRSASSFGAVGSTRARPLTPWPQGPRRADGPPALRWLRAGTIVVLAGLLAGCPCSLQDLDRAFEEDWEDCAGSCGWEVLEGQAVVVETFHSSQHALQFGGPLTTIEHAVSLGSRTCSDGPCEMQLSVVTNCHGDLSVETVYREASGAELPRTATLECTDTGAHLEYCQGTVALDGASSAAEPPAPLGALRLHSTRDGCVVDDIILQTFHLFCGA